MISASEFTTQNICWGIGLRPQQISDLHAAPALPILEILADNIMSHQGGPLLWHTQQLAERTPTILHSVGLNIGSIDPLDFTYLAQLKRLIQRFQPRWVSDHICFTKAGGRATFELMPLPRNAETIEYLSKRIKTVQDYLECPIVLENPSAYIDYRHSVIPEPIFYNQLCQAAGIQMLFDVNNFFVNAFNFQWDAMSGLEQLDPKHIAYLHLSGHSPKDDFLFDTHDQTIASSVWQLFTALQPRLAAGTIAVIERDDDDVAYSVYLQEIEFGQSLIQSRKSTDYGLSSNFSATDCAFT